MSTKASLRPESRVSPHTRRPRGWRSIVFPLVAILLGLTPFVVLECVLAVLDVGSSSGQEDPFVGFSRTRPLFEFDQQSGAFRTARSRQVFFGQQQFAEQKPAGTFRVFGLGGSTMRGRPYDTDTSFLKWLEIELNGRDSALRYETVNCGGLSYASYRVTRILDEVLQYEPDLIVIATGHNEFLEDRSYDSIKNRSALASWMAEQSCSFRTVNLIRQLGGGPTAVNTENAGRFELESEVNTRLDSKSGYASYRRDVRWRADVIEHFEQSVRGMVDACRKAQVPLVLVNLGENLRDCPPFKSEHKPGLSAESARRWQSLFDAATAKESGHVADALRVYRDAESIDDEHALLSYRIAGCYDRLRDIERARRYYSRAKDLDICPLRMLDEMSARLKRVAVDTDTPMVDAEQLLIAMSPDEIPGNNCYLDHVHPSIGSHQRIAQALAVKLEEMSLLSGSQPWEEHERRHVYRRAMRQLGPSYLADGWHRIGWLEKWSRRHLLGSDTLPNDARGFLHLGFRQLDFGQSNLAWEQIGLAVEEDPALAVDVLDHALGLFKAGRSELADDLLSRLHDDPHASAVRDQSGFARLVVALDAGRTSEAKAIYNLRRAVIDRVAQSSRGWVDVMPDALERVNAEAR